MNLWKSQIHICYFYWFIQGFWYYWPCKIIKNAWIKSTKGINRIKGTNLALFKNYLRNRKQYIQITNNCKIDLRNTTCKVPQASILGPLLFLVYVNHLPSSSKILGPIMFTDDTNLFHEHKKCHKTFRHSKWRIKKYKWLAYGK